jgi:uncharacterized protein YndB with AHSA1/START domain
MAALLTAASLIGPSAEAQTNTAFTGARKSLTVDRIVAATPEQVWNVLRSGADVDEWFPVIATCKLHGEGEGAKRTCTTADGKTIQESIVTVDNEQRIFQYRIDHQEMMPIRDMLGTMRVYVQDSKTHVRWTAEFEMTMEEAFAQVQDGIIGMYFTGLDGLERLASTKH